VRSRPYLFVGWFWFAGVLVPFIGLIQAGAQALADRFAYLPLVGIFIILAWTGAEFLDALRLSARPGVAAAVLLLVLCAALTRYQLGFWLNTETIFTRALAVTQNNWVAHYHLGLLALRRYQDTQRGPVEKQVLKLESTPRNPVASGPAPRDYLGEVIYQCQAALRSKPGFPDPRVTLAKALTEQGRLDEARAQLEMAIRLDPKSAQARQNLAEILHRQGRVADAITEYKTALKLRPDWEQVLNNLAWLLATHPSPNVRNGPEAVRIAERACALTSRTNLWFLHTLAAAYAESGDFAQAVAAAQEARQLAAASGLSNLLATASARLGLYETHQPLRAP
jgi:tetratricopeptide (TPR) repeat protein